MLVIFTFVRQKYRINKPGNIYFLRKIVYSTWCWRLFSSSVIQDSGTTCVSAFILRKWQYLWKSWAFSYIISVSSLGFPLVFLFLFLYNTKWKRITGDPISIKYGCIIKIYGVLVKKYDTTCFFPLRVLE